MVRFLITRGKNSISYVRQCLLFGLICIKMAHLLETMDEQLKETPLLTYMHFIYFKSLTGSNCTKIYCVKQVCIFLSKIIICPEIYHPTSANFGLKAV